MQVKDVIEDMINQAPALLQGSSEFQKADLTVRGKQDTNEERIDTSQTAVMQWNIPRYTSGSFVGRTDVLGDVERKILNGKSESQRRYVITGVGGMGKSEICLRIIDKTRNR